MIINAKTATIAEEFSMSKYATQTDRNTAMLNSIVQLRAENAELRRLIRNVAIPALAECDDAMPYMSDYDIPLCLPNRVKTGLNTLREAMK